MPSGKSFIPKEIFQEQSTYEIFRNRFVIFIIAVVALIAAFCLESFSRYWN